MVFKKVLKFIGFSFADLDSAKKFIVLFLCVFSFSTFGNISGTELIEDLRNSGNLGIFDSPTINVFEEHCSDMSFSSLNDASKTFCEAVVSSEVCQSVEKKDLMNCNQYENSTDFHGGRFLLGCLKGVVIDAPIALMKFVWETLKWVWDTGTHPVETYQEASEYIESAKLYLATEYDKAYDRSSRPFRRTKAVSAVSGAVSNMFIKSIQDYLSAEYKEFGCLSFQARTNRVCKIIAEIGLPVGAIKLGPKGIKALMAKKGKKGGDGKGPGGGGDSSGGNVVQAQNKIEMTGTPQVKQFKDDLRAGKLPEAENKYVSITQNGDGDEVFGAIRELRSNGDVIVDTVDGRVLIVRDQGINNINPSKASIDYFNKIGPFRSQAMQGKWTPESQHVVFQNLEGKRVFGKLSQQNGRGVVEDINGKRISIGYGDKDTDLKHITISTMHPSDDARRLFEATTKRRREFKDNLRAGKYPEVEEDKYIAFKNRDGKEVFGRIEDVRGNRVFIQTVDGRNIEINTRGQGLNSIRLSKASDEYYNTVGPFRSQAMQGKWTPESQHVVFQNLEGERVFGKLSQQNGRGVVETVDGKRISIGYGNKDSDLSSKVISTMYPSDDARRFFQKEVTALESTNKSAGELVGNVVKNYYQKQVTAPESTNKSAGELVGNVVKKYYQKEVTAPESTNKSAGELVGNVVKNYYQKEVTGSPQVDRIGLGEFALSRKLTPQQGVAIEKAHLVGKGQIGKDGTPARIGNYTSTQLRDKIKILRDAGFSRADRRKLVEDGVVGISDRVGGFFSRNPNPKLQMTGTPQVKQFKNDLRAGKLPEAENKYVSITQNGDGDEVFGAIRELSSSGDVIVDTVDGRVLIVRDQGINNINPSKASSEYFNKIGPFRSQAMQGKWTPESQHVVFHLEGKRVFGKLSQQNGRGFVEDINGKRTSISGNDSSRIVNTMYPSDDARRLFEATTKRRREFKDNLRAGKYPEVEEDKYIAFKNRDGKEVFGRIEDVRGNRVFIQTVDGRNIEINTRGQGLNSIRLSKASDEYYNTIGPFRSQAMQGKWTPESQHVVFQNLEGERVFGKLSQQNGRGVVETVDGKRISIGYGNKDSDLSSKVISTMYPSDDARRFFQKQVIAPESTNKSAGELVGNVVKNYYQKQVTAPESTNKSAGELVGNVVKKYYQKEVTAPESTNKSAGELVGNVVKNYYQKEVTGSPQVDRIGLGEFALSRKLTPQQASALQQAHLVGKGQIGKDGTPARIGNYTSTQLRDKIKILRDAGFSRAERRKLVEEGVVGVRFSGRKAPLGTFRSQAMQGKWYSEDHRYIVFLNLEGEEVFGKLNQQNGQVFVETAGGKRIPIGYRDKDTDLKHITISTMHPSDDAKMFFESR